MLRRIIILTVSCALLWIGYLLYPQVRFLYFLYFENGAEKLFSGLGSLAQTNNNNNQALADCVQAAEQKYKDTWEAICAKVGKEGYCFEFRGSPRDKEFSELRLQELRVCAQLYSR